MRNAQQKLEFAITLNLAAKYSDAEVILRSLVDRDTTNVDFICALCDALFGQEKFDECRDRLEAALTIHGENLSLNTLMALVLVKLGDPAGAVRYGEKNVAICPDSAESHFDLGRLYMLLAKHADASRAFQQCLRLDPHHTAALHRLARIAYSAGDLQNAKQHLIQAVKVSPECDQALTDLGWIYCLEEKFEEAATTLHNSLKLNSENAQTHSHLGVVYHELNEHERARFHYLRSEEHGGASAALYASLARLRRDAGSSQEAIKYFDRALEFSPDCDQVKEEKAAILQNAIPSWHFVMLADENRNIGYQNAINKVARGKNVLDIGTGSGLLSMMAAKAGAKRIDTCEVVSELATIAKDIVEDNGFSDRITVHNMLSTQMSVGTELPVAADLLVSEILDAGLLGENVLASHRHALANLTTKDVTVIPARAEVYGAVYEIPNLSNAFPLKDVCGFDLSRFNQFRVPNSYAKHHLEYVGHTRLSEVVLIQQIDFRELPPYYSNDDPLRFELDLPIRETGTAHAFCFWFDLHLDNDIVLSTSEHGEMRHWGQAFLFLKQHRRLNTGEISKLEVSQSENAFKFSLK